MCLDPGNVSRCTNVCLLSEYYNFNEGIYSHLATKFLLNLEGYFCAKFYEILLYDGLSLTNESWYIIKHITVKSNRIECPRSWFPSIIFAFAWLFDMRQVLSPPWMFVAPRITGSCSKYSADWILFSKVMRCTRDVQ